MSDLIERFEEAFPCPDNVEFINARYQAREPYHWGADKEAEIQNTLLKGWYAALEQQQWIPVSERLPEKGELVLIFEAAGRIQVAKRCYEEWGDKLDFYVQLTQCWSDDSYPTLGVTHWMPLPQPPTAEDG